MKIDYDNDNGIISEDVFFEDFETPTEQHEQPAFDVIEVPNSVDAKVIESFKKVNQTASKSIIKFTDTIFAFGLSMYALSNSPEEYRLSKEEEDYFIEMLTAAMPDTKKAMPEWVSTVFAILTIYGMKIHNAKKDRTANQQNKDLEQKN